MADDRKDLLTSRRSPLRAAAFRVANSILYTIEWFIAKASKVDTTPFLSPADFPWARDFEARWTEIRDEVLALLEHKQHLPNFQEISKDQDQLTQDDLWKTVFLEAYGITSEANRERCPVTAELTDGVPGLKLAMFSMLSGGKHIPAHRGPYKGVVRYHLGLVVPDPPESTRIRVGNEIRSWREGEGMFFDDSYNHEVWNDSEQDRVVLFLDIVRPCRFPFDILNRFILWGIARSPFVRDLERNQREWEERYERAIGAPAN
jgi:beta-hydroxylase